MIKERKHQFSIFNSFTFISRKWDWQAKTTISTAITTAYPLIWYHLNRVLLHVVTIWNQNIFAFQGLLDSYLIFLFFSQSIRYELLHHLRWPVPAEWLQPAPVDAPSETGGDPVRLQWASQWEGSGAGAAVHPCNLVRSRPSCLLARIWHSVPKWHVVLCHRLGQHPGWR